MSFDESLSDAGWKPLRPVAVYAVGAASALLLAIHAVSAEGWIPLVDSANLALHEAGHPIIGLFSNQLMVYGGTIFQLLFPALVVVHFVRERDAVGAATGGVWLGENLLNIARYMADAREQVLPLVGGGEHDWTEIFSRWGVLSRDVRIAGFTLWLGYALMLGVVVWLWRRFKEQQTMEAM
ncbi:MAG: hypothetical protein Q8S26_06935 [Azonexus sp.]|nr:hypothetical protein [Azonexus sp.]